MKYFTSLFILFLLPCLTAFASPYDKIRFLINDKVVTQNEIRIRLYEEARRRQVNLNDPQEKEKLEKEVTQVLIEETLLDVYADEIKINISESRLEDELDSFKKQRNLSQTSFEELLEQQQLTLSGFRKNFVRRLRQSQVLSREVHSQIQVDESELKAQYEKGKKKIAKIHARHILLRLAPDATEEVIKQTRRRILLLKEQIQSGDISFTNAAELYSEDPSAKSNKGDLGFFRKEDIVAEFAQVAFTLPLNTLSEPVKTVFGYHLIEVLEKKNEEGVPFEQVKKKLIAEARQKVFQEKYKEFIEKLKKKVKIIEK